MIMIKKKTKEKIKENLLESHYKPFLFAGSENSSQKTLPPQDQNFTGMVSFIHVFLLEEVRNRRIIFCDLSNVRMKRDIYFNFFIITNVVTRIAKIMSKYD